MDLSPFKAKLRNALANLTVLGPDSNDALWSVLYYAASKEGTTLPTMFPLAEPKDFPKGWASSVSLSSRQQFFENKQVNFTHVGRNCGRKFKKGEPIYRCLDCSFDNTCVLCVHCFNKEDHIGHQVNASICSSGNTGICDCGDPEAWKRELHCKCNSKAEAEVNDYNGVFNEDYELFLKVVYDVCLDFVIEVFARQNQTLPVVNERLRRLVSRSGDQKEAIDLLKKDISQQTLNAEKYGMKDMIIQYCVVLWNDEFHNFHEAQSAIISATSTSRTGAKQVATQVDKEGRTILLENSSLEALITGFTNVQSNGLTATIMSKVDFLRQDYTKTIIDWISDTINFPNTAFQKIARRALCKSLCSQYNSDDLGDSVWSSLYSTDSGLLNGQHLPYISHETIDFTKRETSATTTISDITKESSTLALETRMQYLLFFDLRYWKLLRAKVHDLLIPSLVSDLEYKIIAANQIVEIYGLLMSNLSKLDREPHISALDEISCQFFTCPTNSTNIISTEKIRDVLYPVVRLFDSHSRPLNSEVKKFRIPHRMLDKSTSIRKSFTRSINDLNYMFDKTTTINNFFLPENFMPFCYLLRLFDSNWEIQRKVGEHVENETYDFVDYFGYTLQLLGVVYAASDASKLNPVDRESVALAIQKLLHLLSLQPSDKSKVYKSYELVDFEVSKEYTGFMNPSNVFLSRLLQIAAKSSEDILKVVDGFDFVKIADSSLRAIVLCVQIESQFWVRNGLSSLKQAYTYKSPQLVHDTGYYRDVHLTQIGLLCTDPERAFLNILNRFELLDWFSNKMQLTNTVYEDKVYTILEKLISFFYVLISERSLFMEFESTEKEIRHRLKQVLIYTLYYKPLTYSEIEESLSDDLSSYERLDEILNEVSMFTAPRGLNDDGRYSLKSDYYKFVDPLKLLAQVKDFQDNTTVLCKALSETDKPVDDIILEPKLAKLESYKTLADFTRTNEFAKFVYKLLEYALQNNQDTYVPQLLHLLHAVFKDDEMVNAKDHIIESFVQIPVCESLFSIATSSDFSKQTTRKADYLLESLIVKNSRSFFETLTSCFGEEAVNVYKEKKKSSGVNFDESEPERKRRIAKERQKKILEKMSKKQKLFIEKNDTGAQDEESENSDTPEGVRHCVLCQGAETPEDLFGIPASFVKSNVFRHLPSHDKYFIQRAFKNWDDDSVGNNPEAVGLGFPLSENRRNNFETHTIASSCNHGMHFKCLKDYMREHNHSTPSFACPLCKTYHNHFLPVFNPKNIISHEILSNSSSSVFESFVDQTMDVSFGSYGDGFEDSLDVVLGRDFEKAGADVKYFTRMLNILSSSIRQAEISTRINGSSSYSEFLKQIPEQTYRVLRGVFQTLTIFQQYRHFSKSDLGHHPDHEIDVVYQLIVSFFMGTSDMREDIRERFVDVAGEYLCRLLSRVFDCGEFSVELTGEMPSQEQINAFKSLISDSGIPLPVKQKFLADDQFSVQIVKMTELMLLPQLRSLCIFFRVLFPDFDLQKSDDDSTVLNDLLSSLGFPNYHEVIRVSMENKERTAFKFDDPLPYPGVIKLVDLPTELNFFTTTTNDISTNISKRFEPEVNISSYNNRIDFSVCLTCGKKVFKTDDRNEKLLHMKNTHCDSGPDGLYLTPNTDVVNLMSSTVSGHYSKIVNAPFLNSHGQSGNKAVQNGQIARLNVERYKYLNSLWLTGSIFSYLSRNSSPVFPRLGLDNNGEERFWQQFLANARTDLEVQNMDDDDQPFVFTFPPGANYVNELRGPVINDEDEEDSEMDSDQMDEDDEDDDGFGFFTEEEEEEFLEGELDHFEDVDNGGFMSEDDMYIDGYYDNDGFEVADDMEIDHFDDDLDSDDVD